MAHYYAMKGETNWGHVTLTGSYIIQWPWPCLQ